MVGRCTSAVRQTTIKLEHIAEAISSSVKTEVYTPLVPDIHEFLTKPLSRIDKQGNETIPDIEDEDPTPALNLLYSRKDIVTSPNKNQLERMYKFNPTDDNKHDENIDQSDVK
jgi:hypothetical protein